MKPRGHRHGYAALPAVTGLALMVALSLTLLFQSTLLRRAQASRTQLQTDRHQREEALMRGIVAALPSRAVACMKADYAASEDYSWGRVFARAAALASIHQPLTPETARRLGLPAGVRSADVGNHDAGQSGLWITSLTGEPGKVTPGTTAYADVFALPAFAGKVPPLLGAPTELEEADAARPVVSPLKRYTTQAPGLLAGVAEHPVYNLIPYPNIRFGYAEPGQPFVAKRNWWAFSVKFGGDARAVARHYILSLYEIPSQMPLEAATFARIGRHENGAAWNADAVRIQGGVYADTMEVEGAFGAERLAGRSGIGLKENITLGGLELGADFDALGVRERLQAQRGGDALPAALSANSGRLAFLPLQSGTAFLEKTGDAPSATAWERYTAGGGRCSVKVEALAMVSYEDQTPTALRVQFQTPAGTTSQIVLQRGVNWPAALEPGGATLPFQTELTNNSRSCLTFFPSLFDGWVQSVGGASTAVNHSLWFGVDSTAAPDVVRVPASPPAPEDMCVIIRKGRDLTPWSRGLSVVAPLRVYVGDDLNEQAAAAPPAGSGLAAGEEYFPPMSIFAAELRVGTTAVNRLIEHHGQLGTLMTGGVEAWRPLDMKSGSDDAVHTDNISADLAPLRSPAGLPPVHQMNWLVVIEEIPQS